MKGDTTKVESCGGLSSKALDKFLKSFWDYYRKLLAYQNAPSDEAAQKLRSEFWDIFATQSGYEELDERKQLTAKKWRLLLVLSILNFRCTITAELELGQSCCDVILWYSNEGWYSGLGYFYVPCCYDS